MLVLAFAALANVEFEVGAGSAIPTQLIFVPMLFLLPLGWVPLAVAAGYWVSLNADVVRGRRHRERVVVLLSSCWYVLGPVAVLLAWGEGPPRWDRWPVYVAALLAQFGADLASTLIRERRALGISLRRLVPMAAIAYGVDAALAPLGLLAAFAAIEMSYAFVLLLPVAVLLAIFARERAQRLEQEEELNVAYRRTMLLLGDIIESDDAYTGSHSRGVVELVSEVAEVLQLSAGERTQAEFTALLHDVGKIRIPKELIQKPEPLTPEERALIETHTIEGQLILKQVGGSLEEVGQHRALLPRVVERQGLSRPPGRRADPTRRPDRVLLRRLQRDDDRPPLPRRAHTRGRRRRAAGVRRLAVRPARRRGAAPCPRRRRRAGRRAAPGRLTRRQAGSRRPQSELDAT